MSSIFSRRSLKTAVGLNSDAERASEMVKPGTRTLETEDLGKAYGGRQVVRGVSMEIAQGEVVGLLGPNGAGRRPAST